MRILVTGATGVIGRHLVHALTARGDVVTVTSRDRNRAHIELAVQAHTWNPLAGPPPSEALVDVDAIVHLLGEGVADGRWTPARKQAIRDSRIIGTRNLVAGIGAVGSPGPRTLVHGSAIGLYDVAAPDVVDENGPLGNDFLAEVVKDWEAEACHAEAQGLRVVLLRTGVVLAPDGGAFTRMLTPFKLGIGGRVGSGRQGFPWIHIADEVGLILHALDKDDLRGPLNAVAPQPIDSATFANALGKALHRPAFMPTPAFALKALFGEMANVLLTGVRVRPAVAERTGYEFRFPEIDAALADLVAANESA